MKFTELMKVPAGGVRGNAKNTGGVAVQGFEKELTASLEPKRKEARGEGQKPQLDRAERNEMQLLERKPQSVKVERFEKNTKSVEPKNAGAKFSGAEFSDASLSDISDVSEKSVDTQNASDGATIFDAEKSVDQNARATNFHAEFQSADKNAGVKKAGAKNPVEFSDAKSTGAKSTDAKNTAAKNIDAKNIDAKNTDAKNTDAKNTDAKSTDAKNIDAKNTDATNIDAKDAQATDELGNVFTQSNASLNVEQQNVGHGGIAQDLLDETATEENGFTKAETEEIAATPNEKPFSFSAIPQPAPVPARLAIAPAIGGRAAPAPTAPTATPGVAPRPAAVATASTPSAAPAMAPAVVARTDSFARPATLTVASPKSNESHTTTARSSATSPKKHDLDALILSHATVVPAPLIDTKKENVKTQVTNQAVATRAKAIDPHFPAAQHTQPLDAPARSGKDARDDRNDFSTRTDPKPDPTAATTITPRLIDPNQPRFELNAIAPPIEAQALAQVAPLMLEDASLRAVLLPTVARLSLETPESGRLNVQLKVNDGVTEIRASGPAAQLLESRQGELRVALAREGLALGHFDLTQQQHQQPQHQNETSEEAIPQLTRRVVTQSSSSSTRTVTEDGRLHVKA